MTVAGEFQHLASKSAYNLLSHSQSLSENEFAHHLKIAAFLLAFAYKHNQIPNNSRIRWSVLSYSKLLNTTTDDKAVYVPTWTVEIKTKNSGAIQQLQVNAFNSTVMKETPDSVNTNSLNDK